MIVDWTDSSISLSFTEQHQEDQDENEKLETKENDDEKDEKDEEEEKGNHDQQQTENDQPPINITKMRRTRRRGLEISNLYSNIDGIKTKIKSSTSSSSSSQTRLVITLIKSQGDKNTWYDLTKSKNTF